MGSLVANELRRAFRGAWFRGSMLVLVVLAIIAGLQEGIPYQRDLLTIIRGWCDEKYYFHTLYSCFNMWLPVRAVFEAGALFFTLLPFLAIVCYAWSYAADVHSGYVAQLLTRVSREKFYVARYIAVFVSAGLLATVPLVVNLLVVASFFPAYMPSAVDSMYIGISDNDLFSAVFFTAPHLYVGLRLLVNFVLCGLWAVMVLGFSTISQNRIALVCLPYIVILLVKYVGEKFFVLERMRGNAYFGMSITLFDQLKATPDNFYCYWWATLLCATLMLLLSVVLPALRRKADVL